MHQEGFNATLQSIGGSVEQGYSGIEGDAFATAPI